jgi:flotillin
MYTIITISVALISLVAIFMALVARYKRCPSDKILVVYGKTGKNKLGETQSAKCIHGGATFVMPVIQDYRYLDLTPIPIDIDLKNALSKQNIRVDVPSNFTVAISTEPNVMKNAAERLLELDTGTIKKLAHDIIIGQMRLVVATMDIEEINSNREIFLKHIQENLESELSKIGLELVNVNVTDITDESGYIEALGKEAAAFVINQAKRTVAEKNRDGEIGQANAQQDQRTQVANATASALIGEQIADAERRQKVADANATATEGENTAQIKIAESNSKKSIAESLALKSATIAENVNAANSKSESYESQRQAEEKRAKRDKATQYANIVVPAEISKSKIEIDSEAQAEQIRRIARGEADSIKLKAQAEADGAQAILEGMAEGLERVVKAAGGDADKAMGLMIIDKLPEIVKLNSEAIQNIKFDKITVWENGGNGNSGEGGSSTGNFLNNLITGTLPMSDDIYKMIGKTLPGIIDVRDENSSNDSSDEVKAIEQNAIDEKSDSKK